MFKSILVPLDGSRFGEHALPLALSIARRAGARLQLVHVYPPLAGVYSEGFYALNENLEKQLKDSQRDYLEGVSQRLAKVAPVPVGTTLLEGEVASTLCETAASTGTDLVVMTTHARSPMGRFWLGSVADELVRHLTAPLLLVRPGEGEADLAKEPVLKHLLLPLDGSALAEQILAPATNLGRLMDADYTLLRVIRPVMPVHYSMEGVSYGAMAQSVIEQIESVHEQLKKEAQTYLDGVAAKLRGQGLRVDTRIDTETQPALAIIQEAAPPVDAVALETHGRRGLSRMFLGSVADKVIRGVHVPVLVQRPAAR